MKILQSALRSANGLSRQTCLPWTARSIFTGNSSGDGTNDGKNNNPFESPDDFERRIFGGFWDKSSNGGSFFQKLDRIEKAHGRSGMGSKMDDGSNMQFGDGIGENFDTLSDGMDAKLKKAATTFAYDEMKNDDYSFRPDVTFRPGVTYDIKDLDLTKSGVQKTFKRPEFEVTSKEVMRKADFRNVRFLAQFITEVGIIIKRSKTRISAKAQRKVAREIKTARAFGLMPFTTMGTKPFIFGRTMEDLDKDIEFDNYYNQPVSTEFDA